MPDTYKTEDGVLVKEGDRVYNYYDMKPGIVGRSWRGGWFTFLPDEGGQVSILNGQRICSMEFAVRKGWPGARTED